jgi:hypothetical protein
VQPARAGHRDHRDAEAASGGQRDHGLPDSARRGAVAGLTELAAPGATLLMIALKAGRRMVLPRGMDKQDIAALDTAEVVQKAVAGGLDVMDALDVATSVVTTVPSSRASRPSEA